MSEADKQRMEQINSIVKDIMAKVAEANRLVDYADAANQPANF